MTDFLLFLTLLAIIGPRLGEPGTSAWHSIENRNYEQSHRRQPFSAAFGIRTFSRSHSALVGDKHACRRKSMFTAKSKPRCNQYGGNCNLAANFCSRWKTKQGSGAAARVLQTGASLPVKQMYLTPRRGEAERAARFFLVNFGNILRFLRGVVEVWRGGLDSKLHTQKAHSAHACAGEATLPFCTFSSQAIESARRSNRDRQAQYLQRNNERKSMFTSRPGGNVWLRVSTVPRLPLCRNI